MNFMSKNLMQENPLTYPIKVFARYWNNKDFESYAKFLLCNIEAFKK